MLSRARARANIIEYIRKNKEKLGKDFQGDICVGVQAETRGRHMRGAAGAKFVVTRRNVPERKMLRRDGMFREEICRNAAKTGVSAGTLSTANISAGDFAGLVSYRGRHAHNLEHGQSPVAAENTAARHEILAPKPGNVAGSR